MSASLSVFVAATTSTMFHKSTTSKLSLLQLGLLGFSSGPLFFRPLVFFRPFTLETTGMTGLGPYPELCAVWYYPFDYLVS